jgi:hypothetical protein
MGRFTPLACLCLLLAACGSPGASVSGAQPAMETATTESAQGQQSGGVESTPDSPTETQPVPPADEVQVDDTNDCVPEPFEFPPVDLDAVEYLTPFGLMTGSHVTPVDHQYFQNFKEPDRRIEVFAPGDGRVISMQHFGTPITEDATGLVDDYRLVIEHTCTVSSIFIHIAELNATLATQAPDIGQYSSVDIPVTAGETIGWFTANVDYNLVDQDFVTDGLVDLSSYEREPWKAHVPETFGYFIPAIGKQMEALSLRTTEPRGGVFTHDIDGRLVGNWFEEGTNGYQGVGERRYWAGHLSFAYNHIDPSMVWVSIGTFIDQSQQFAVVGNSPDPASVSVETGPVTYELVGWEYWVGESRWDRVSLAQGITALPSTDSSGSVLVQLLDDRTLMMETFPGIGPSEVDGFTSAARTFTR